MPAEENYTATDELYEKLIAMADHGQINEAENLLLEELEHASRDTCEAALSFYDHINGFTNEFLEEHNYTREEIQSGLKDLAKRMGYEALIDTLI